MKGIAWLKRMNARGNNILIQPDEESGMVLISKLAKDALAAMNRLGFEPAVTVETLPGAFQAWVRLTTSPASANALLMASIGLARRFSGAADTAGYLAGFTVHDTVSTSHELRPFAFAHEGRQGTASLGAAYMAKVARELQTQAERSKQRGRGFSR
jgi:hypothetical protein